MSLEQDIRAEIESIKKLKLAVGEINNHLSILEGMCRQDKQKLIDDAYKRGLSDVSASDYQHGYNDVYKRGFEDGKNGCDKGCNGCRYESHTSHDEPCCNCCNAYLNKYAPMPKQDDINVDDEIKVGDEVQLCDDPNVCFVVLSIDILNEEISGFDRNGHTYFCRPKDDWRKTGRHFDIESILEAMGE